ncbi:TIGR03792 family protein [Cyanobium sp. ATX 6F1]|uniref:TIGR03792 family protein n=1 Tax=unclassified Cyanobium TaxID=2627006 RepID=UPI0020CCB1C6|nr:TIGR03792 family protein [Cyanobium sp. ATX 6F1]
MALLQPQSAAASGAAPTPLADQAEVVELLRLSVPASARACWLQAEASSWGPWLDQQRGYRGRQLLWDAARQEGLILIGWASRSDWKSIPAATLDQVQERFEAAARRCLAANDPGTGKAASGERPVNPFPIVETAELVPERPPEPATSELP